MRPGRLNFILLLDSGFGELEIRLLEVGERSENVLLNHGHDVIQMGNDQTDDSFLVLQKLLDFVNGVKSFGLALNIL